MTNARLAGFTLMEALVATTLSTVLVMLVTSVFLVQNRFFDHVLKRSQVQESARSVAELVASELRAATRGSVVLAEESRLTARTPQVIGVICDKTGANVDVYVPLDGTGVDPSQVTGYGIQEADDSWSFYAERWSDFYLGSGQSGIRSNCYEAGVDTAGASAADFLRFGGPGLDPSPPPDDGDLIMIYREIEYEIRSSGLSDGALGLFRGVAGHGAVEFATGLASEARFEYRLDGQTDFQSSVTGSDLDDIVTVRLVSMATETEGLPGDEELYTYGFTVDIPLRNVP